MGFLARRMQKRAKATSPLWGTEHSFLLRKWGPAIVDEMTEEPRARPRKTGETRRCRRFFVSLLFLLSPPRPLSPSLGTCSLARMLALAQSPTHSPLASPYASPSAFLPPRPNTFRRPSALRSASSDIILTSAVTRFDQRKPVVIPRPHDKENDVAPPRYTVQPSRTTSPAPRNALHRPAPPIPSAAASSTSSLSRSATVPSRPSARPLPGSSSSSSSSSSSTSADPPSSGSLLARRRSSRSASVSGTQRPNFTPFLPLADLSLSLPAAPLEDILDDTVRPKIIGESAAAVTPVREEMTPGKEGQAVRVVEGRYKPTKKFVSTPFPTRTEFLSDDDDDDDDEEEEEKKEEESAVEAGADVFSA